ncbi:DUF6950 family protein [Pantoea agglomerans]|uniref:DUF6950 family protein n=1 Tax=Enterobacter agglomerans TaxID=549 RepID=UPI003C7B0C7C
MKNIINIIKITEEAINTPYEIGKNDCNIIVLKLLDIVCGTEYQNLAVGQYTSITAGKKLFKVNGFKNLEDIIKRHCDEVDTAIYGDIWIDGLNASIFLHGSYIEVDHELHKFKSVQVPSELTGKIYRINKDKEINTWADQVQQGS